ncbi:betaine--homocysteine S-methyltransferase 1-like [Engraulis encrasicolus]|uniref:betaine--homocysteine S-methyltransferase 1-like n=1 Tax=Engraulis encrasicolus TaxID=184585 RepID=UPI002FD268FD
MASAKRKGILERLDAGEVVVGDGGYVFQLERRGYVKGGPWTPEAVVEHPEAVRQLHREFLRAGADVMQTLTFFSSVVDINADVPNLTVSAKCQQINEMACDMAREVANENGALVSACVSQTPVYNCSGSEAEVKAIIKMQLDVFLKKDIDFLMAEYFADVEEAVWVVEVLVTSGKPVAATLCMSPAGDKKGVSPAECAVRLAKAGAKIVGVNCHVDPAQCIQTVQQMKAGLDAAGLKAHLMIQPLCFHCPDCTSEGYFSLPEAPFALESRVLNRWDVHKYAREAYNAGIRYIGGCCGFEPYHIRAIAEELAPERGFLPPASQKHGAWGSALDVGSRHYVRARACRSHWENLKPASGRPLCPSLSTPDS